MLVATARRLASVVASGVQVDVLAGSANDRGERYELADLPVRPRLCVWTEGADGGRYLADDGSEGRWEAVAAARPDRRRLRRRRRLHGGAHARARRAGRARRGARGGRARRAPPSSRAAEAGRP